MSEPINKCSKCQGEFTKKGDKYLYWTEKGKEDIQMCCACKDKLEKGGLQHSNLQSTMKSMTSSDPGLETRSLCKLCFKKVREEEIHKWNEEGKLIIKHDCQMKCEGYGFHHCGKKFQLTQSYVDLLHKYNIKITDFERCPNCQIKQTKQDLNLSTSKQEKERNQKFLSELEKLIGKGNDDDNRERERERANSTILCWKQYPIHYFTGW
jgi:hypothetical protein